MDYKKDFPIYAEKNNIGKGCSLYFSHNQYMLILEAIDMLECEYAENEHPEQQELDKIKYKIVNK